MRVPACALAVALIGGVAACSGDQPPATPPSATASSVSSAASSAEPTPAFSPTSLSSFTALTGGPVLAVKIDNTAASRPRIGVGAADVVYVEPVEAGLTRLLAVFSSTMPAEVGPVRSARESDVDLLASWGPVAFAFSGASGGTLAALAQGRQVNLSNDASRTGFRRAADRPAPYNVIGSTAQLLARAGGSVAPADPGFRFGAPSPGGAPAPSVATAWTASRMALTWDGGRGRYLVATDGTPDLDADGTQHGAATVVVQHVPTHLSANRDVNGVQTPLVDVVGQGSVDVLRGGQVWHGTWARPSAAAPTSFVAADGTPIAMAPGPVWVLLVPQGQAVTLG